MKKLMTLIALAATFSTLGAQIEGKKIEISMENVETLEQMLKTGNKFYGGWECEAQAMDGAGGVGQARSRAQAARMAVNFCRNYSYEPYSCRVFSCYRL
ncbi:hypothetical protein A9Q84_17025 [Halobacteriovorax marinus]|uniref:DUF4189 domain-containing protein n=1 Tax=Halobacteriovorax marinus TaxID=97084 RepID=A0A1Y5F3K5_9BACT|nr:hypothetical protein A9Q84_17025 [Halobacteriovorax marinus]